jgi:hypothetical protein
MMRKTSWPLVLGVGGEVVAAQKEWASHRCVPQGIGPVSLFGLSSIDEPQFESLL